MLEIKTAWDKPYRPLTGDHAAAYMLEMCPVSTDKIPVHVHILLDISGSMNKNNKLHEAKKACEYIIGNLGPDDSFSLTAFNDLLHPEIQKIYMNDENKNKSIHSVQNLAAGGVTLLDACLEDFLQRASPDTSTPCFVFLISDGRPTDKKGTRVVEWKTYFDLASRVGQAGARMIAVALGDPQDYEPDFFNALAQRSGGPFRYSPQAQDLQNVIREDLRQIHHTAVNNVHVNFDFFEPSTHLYWFGRAHPDKQFFESIEKGSLYLLGSLSQQQIQTYIAYLMTCADLNTLPGTQTIGKITVRADIAGRVWQEEREIQLEFTDNPELLQFEDKAVKRWRMEMEETDRTLKAVDAQRRGDQEAFQRHLQGARKSRSELGKPMEHLDNFFKTRLDDDKDGQARLIEEARKSRRSE